MANLRPRTRLACFLLALAAAGCGGGGGGGGAAVDMTGYWALYLTPTGSSTETGPSAVFINQLGSTLDGAAMTGSVNGSSFNLTANAVVFTITASGSVSGTTATGTINISGSFSATGTFRMVRFTPTGTVSASGTIGGNTINMSTMAGVGCRQYTDVAKTNLNEVEIVAAYGDEHLEIDFTASGLAVGALNVPSPVFVSVTYRNDTSPTEVSATSGTVTVTSYDASGIAGTFTLNLSGGGTITGSFDVSFDLDSYDP